MFLEVFREGEKIFSVQVKQCPGSELVRVHPVEDPPVIYFIHLQTRSKGLEKLQATTVIMTLNDNHEGIQIVELTKPLRKLHQPVVRINQFLLARLESQVSYGIKDGEGG